MDLVGAKETCEVFGKQVHLAFAAGLPELPNPGAELRLGF